jgi:flagellar L-ring protein precursor FlgH
MIKKSFYFLVPLFIVGCSHPMDPNVSFEPPKYVEQMPSKEVEDTSNLGSLFGNGENTLFSDKKAMKVNDIVTIVITESVKASSSGKKQTSEITTSPTTAFNTLLRGAVHTANLLGGNVQANSVDDMSSTKSFTGTGSATREESFTATVTARIIKVLQNGNYFVAGTREVMVNGEKQIIRVAGVIRGSDIDSTNTIDSKYISEARIEYKTEGQIARATDKNWFAKLLDTISPW